MGETKGAAAQGMKEDEERERERERRVDAEEERRSAKERREQIVDTFRTRKSTCSEAREGTDYEKTRKKESGRERGQGGRGYAAATTKRIGEDRTRWAARDDEERDIGEESEQNV